MKSPDEQNQWRFSPANFIKYAFVWFLALFFLYAGLNLSPYHYFIPVATLLFCFPFLLRTYRKEIVWKRHYPLGRIVLALIVLTLFGPKELVPHFPYSDSEPQQTSPATESTAEDDEQQAALSKIAQEARKGLSPKALAKLEKAERDKELAEKGQNEICTIVFENMERVNACVTGFYDGKATLTVSYTSPAHSEDDEKGLTFSLYNVLSKLYNSPYRFKRTSFVGYADLTDRYGNTSNGVWSNVTLDEEQAYKLNWSLDPILLTEYLPNVWELKGPILSSRR